MRCYSKLKCCTIVLIVSMVTISCTPSFPYEIRSPCVASDIEPSFLTPCIRRPVNLLHDFA
ncbi:MAG TPA: DUF2706 domain-containing protein [Candidatus Megaira endosymbiont of Nemacystus decipiens]|nr:DUF2706 domain-containing protein [Candidatus Megaera endosymbiont of Nemacystus decipiens]